MQFFASAAGIGLASAATHAELVDLSFDPDMQTVQVGDTVEIDLIASSSDATDHEFDALDAVISWDSSVLGMISSTQDNAGASFFATGFLNDPDGVNDDLADGDAIFTALAPPGNPVTVPGSPGELIVTTLQFEALQEFEMTEVSFIAMIGDFGETRVLLKGQNITGDISAVATVTIEGDPCPGEGDCCEANGTPGCNDEACCNAVCDDDDFCCENTWDSLCADSAEELCPDLCGFMCPGEGSCFEANGTPGCNDEACCNAVCDIDPFCCDVEWDQNCKDQANETCGNCGGDEAGDCCASNGTPGCDDSGCCRAVCELDDFCCETSWDFACVSLAQNTAECDCGVDNDTCEDRIDITDGDTDFSNVGAMSDGPSPCGQLGSDIFYNYTATCTGAATISTCNQADFDTVIAVYDGCGCPVSEDNLIACNDDGEQDDGTDCSLTSELTIPVVEGNCYKIQLGGFAGATGEGTLSVSCDPCPAECLGDINGDGEVDGADLGLLLGAFGPCPDEGFCCEDLNGDGIVDGADLGLLLGAWGPCPDMADGDECEDCFPVGEGTFMGDTTDNTGDTDDTSCGFEDTIDEWYCYTATCTDTVVVSTCSENTDFDTTLAVFDGCDGAEIACNDDGLGCTEFRSELQFAAVEGETYFIRVSGFNGATGLYDLSISCGIPPQACCFDDGTCQDLSPTDCTAMGGTAQGFDTTCADADCPMPLVNDDCEDRIEIFDGDTDFSNVGATTDGMPDPLCENFGEDQVQSDVWFNYTATCTGELTVSTCDQAFDTKIAVYEGCDCPATNIIGCNDDAPDCTGFTSEVIVNVVEGQCYKIRVGGFGGAQGTGTITITCQE